MSALAAGIGSLVVDAPRQAVVLDEQAAAHLGLGAPPADGLPVDFWLGLFVEQDRVLVHALLLAGVPPGAAERLVVRVPSATPGQVRMLELSFVGSSSVAELVGASRDITAQTSREELRRQKAAAERASQAQSEFMSQVSHELRTPLNAILGFSQLMAMDAGWPLPEAQRERLDLIRHSSHRLLSLIDQLLQLGRLEQGRRHLKVRSVEAVDVVRRCVESLQVLAQERGVTLEVEDDGTAPVVRADLQALEQVLTNLLSNAVKYNREQGRISVTTAPAEDGTVRVAVSDTGLGMTPEQMAGLFQPYNRLGRESGPVEGTGIGLVISRRLVELMGGTLEVSSRAGQGSTFTVRLPAAPPPAHEPPAPRPERASRYRQRRVHYVEDNETNIEIMRGVLLQRPQIELEVSMHGLDGLAAIRHRRPDLILLDMQLPAISGLELLRHIKNDDDIASIPVIVVSADATTARMQEALTLGAAHYLTKPVDVPMLLEQVDELLEAQETRWG